MSTAGQRRAYLQGQWYPADPAACEAAIVAHSQGAVAPETSAQGVILPHAGWTFCGDAIGQTVAALARQRPDADTVVVFGSHRGPTGPNTVFCGTGWETPLGVFATAAAAQDLRTRLQLREEPTAPARPDNGVEVLLPFLKHYFPHASLLMLGVAASEQAVDIGQEVGAAVAPDVPVFVGSTDLTHYGPSYGFTPEGAGDHAVDWAHSVNDQGFLDALLANDRLGALQHARSHASACCPGAAVAAMTAAESAGHSPHPTLIRHCSSYDVRPASSFVGYAGVLF